MVLNMDRVDIASLGMFGISSPGCLAWCPLSMRAYFVETESPIGILSQLVNPRTFKKIINISICLHRSHSSHVPGFSFVGDKPPPPLTQRNKKRKNPVAWPSLQSACYIGCWKEVQWRCFVPARKQPSNVHQLEEMLGDVLQARNLNDRGSTRQNTIDLHVRSRRLAKWQTELWPRLVQVFFVANFVSLTLSDTDRCEARKSRVENS